LCSSDILPHKPIVRYHFALVTYLELCFCHTLAQHLLIFFVDIKVLSQSHNYKATYTENVYFQHAVWAIIFKRPWIKILMLDTWKQKCITIKVIRCLYGHLWDWTLCWRISFFLAPLQETCLLIIFVTVYRFIYE
jgi:hypothetical protein